MMLPAVHGVAATTVPILARLLLRLMRVAVTTCCCDSDAAAIAMLLR